MCNTIKRRAKDNENRYSIGIYSKGRFEHHNDSDMDREHYTRSFSGKMTKERYKKLSSFCRFHSRPFRYRCGHEWDCCGCIFAVDMYFTYKYNCVTVHLIHHRNY